MSKNAIVHFEIGGKDGKALQDYYSKLFGWTVNADNPMNYALVYKMDNGIGGGIFETPDGSGVVTVYATCGDDVGAKLKEAIDLGAEEALGVQEIEGGPTIAAFKDPDGNLVGLVNGNPTDTAPVAGSGDPITWFEIAGKDADKTQDFYSKLFGWKIDADNPMKYGMVDGIGNGIGGGIHAASGQTGVTVYAEVENLEDTLAKAKELGGSTIMEPDQVPGGPKIAMFSDPAGNAIGLILKGSSQPA